MYRNGFNTKKYFFKGSLLSYEHHIPLDNTIEGHQKRWSKAEQRQKQKQKQRRRQHNAHWRTIAHTDTLVFWFSFLSRLRGSATD